METQHQIHSRCILFHPYDLEFNRIEQKSTESKDFEFHLNLHRKL